MDHERHDRGVEVAVGQPIERRTQVVYAHVEPVGASTAGEAHHLGALVEPDDLGPAIEELRRVEPGSATGVEDPESLYVPEESENRGAVIERVVGAVLGVHRVLIGECIEQRRLVRGAHAETSNGRCESPRTPGLTRNSPPACGSSASRFSERPFRAVVTYRSERSSPPNAQLVTLVTGNSTTETTSPFGSIRRTAEPPQNATHR